MKTWQQKRKRREARKKDRENRKINHITERPFRIRRRGYKFLPRDYVVYNDKTNQWLIVGGNFSTQPKLIVGNSKFTLTTDESSATRLRDPHIINYLISTIKHTGTWRPIRVYES